MPVSRDDPGPTSKVVEAHSRPDPVDQGGVDIAAAVDLAVRGDDLGWDLLFERFYRQIHRYALVRLGDREAAEDVTQDVFLAAADSLATLRGRGEPVVEAWFFRIARHKVHDHLRRVVRARRQQPNAPAQPGDPAALALARADAEGLRQALERLTDDQRDVVIRRFILDQSLEQVAAVMRRPVGAVKSMQHRALAQLAKRLAEPG